MRTPFRIFANHHAAGLIGAAWTLLVLSPLVYSSIWIAFSKYDFGDLPAALKALANSALLAAVIGTAAWAFGITLLFLHKRLREAIFLIAVCLIVPAQLQAIGMDKFAGLFREPHLQTAVKYMGLLALMFAYVLPFVLASQLFILRNVGRSRLEGLAEYMPGDLTFALMIARVYWPSLFGTWIIGVNIALMEVTRCTYLAVDIFGLGTEYFGPAVLSAYSSTGLAKVFYLISLLTTLPVLAVIIVSGGRSRSMARLPKNVQSDAR